MGKALCVSVYYIITENPDIKITDLQLFNSCLSQYIMDNGFYYGEFEIIGNAQLPKEPDEVDYPIMYGRSISALDRDKICYCRGREYRDIPFGENELLPENFKNNGIGFSIYADKRLIEEYIGRF